MRGGEQEEDARKEQSRGSQQ